MRRTGHLLTGSRTSAAAWVAPKRWQTCTGPKSRCRSRSTPGGTKSACSSAVRPATRTQSRWPPPIRWDGAPCRPQACEPSFRWRNWSSVAWPHCRWRTPCRRQRRCAIWRPPWTPPERPPCCDQPTPSALASGTRLPRSS